MPQMNVEKTQKSEKFAIALLFCAMLYVSLISKKKKKLRFLKAAQKFLKWNERGCMGQQQEEGKEWRWWRLALASRCSFNFVNKISEFWCELQLSNLRTGVTVKVTVILYRWAFPQQACHASLLVTSQLNANSIAPSNASVHPVRRIHLQLGSLSTAQTTSHRLTRISD